MKSSTTADYRDMLRTTRHPYCWLCGYDLYHCPEYWHAPWLIERAHLVNKPRAEDRRAVVLLCSRCHRHAHNFKLPEALPPVKLEHMLWLKWKFDREHYDRPWLQRHAVRLLPPRKLPHREWRSLFRQRQPFAGK